MDNAYAVTSRDLWTVLREIVPDLPEQGVNSASLHVRPERNPDQIVLEWHTVSDDWYHDRLCTSAEKTAEVVAYLESRLGPLNWAWTDKRLAMALASNGFVLINGWLLWLGHPPSGAPTVNLSVGADEIGTTESEE